MSEKKCIIPLINAALTVRVPLKQDRSGSGNPVRDSIQSGTHSTRLKSVRYPQCATQVCLIRANFGSN